MRQVAGIAASSDAEDSDSELTILLAKSYSPYDETIDSVGTFNTSFGFTSEMTDDTGLINLRARWYSPSEGRFIMKDSWSGDYRNPITLVKWLYANANPVMYTDPTGNDPYWCEELPGDGTNNCYIDWWNNYHFSGDNYEKQLSVLKDYVNNWQQPPHSITQVDLSNFEKVSQYTDINSSDENIGYNACGLIAIAAATGAKGDELKIIVNKLLNAAGSDYSGESGIQPSKLILAVTKVFPSNNIVAHNKWSLEEMYISLEKNQKVITDFLVEKGTEIPSASGTTYAHFARVIGMNVDTQQIQIQNTLSGGAYWNISFKTFWDAWQNPERNATIKPSYTEDVTRWAITMN